MGAANLENVSDGFAAPFSAGLPYTLRPLMVEVARVALKPPAGTDAASFTTTQSRNTALHWLSPRVPPAAGLLPTIMKPSRTALVAIRLAVFTACPDDPQSMVARPAPRRPDVTLRASLAWR